MLFQLETKNLETGVISKSPLYGSFAEARAEALKTAKTYRRSVRVVQVPPNICDHCGDEYYGNVQCCGSDSPEVRNYAGTLMLAYQNDLLTEGA